MKTFFLLCVMCILSGFESFAQINKAEEVDVNAFIANSATNLIPVKNPVNRNLEGSYYLFDTWNNYAIVYSGSKALKLKSFNYNLYKDLAEFQISKDSVYSFNSSGIDSLIVNNRVFKPIRKNTNDSRFSEILYQSENILFCKGFKAEIEKQEVNPITGGYDFSDKVEIEENYYLGSSPASLEKVRLRKNQITNALAPFEDEMEKIAKENDLSFKKESDIIRILKLLAI